MPRHRYIEQAPRYLQVYTEGNNEGKVKDSPWSVGLEVVKGSSVKVDSPEYSQGEPGCLMPGPLHLTSEMLSICLSLMPGMLESVEPILRSRWRTQGSCLPDLLFGVPPTPRAWPCPTFPLSSCFLTNSLNVCLAWHPFLLQVGSCLQSYLWGSSFPKITDKDWRKLLVFSSD